MLTRRRRSKVGPPPTTLSVGDVVRIRGFDFRIVRHLSAPPIGVELWRAWTFRFRHGGRRRRAMFFTLPFGEFIRTTFGGAINWYELAEVLESTD